MVDVDTIEVKRFVNEKGEDQEDSRYITWKIPDDPNGVLLGFRFRIWRDDAVPLFDLPIFC